MRRGGQRRANARNARHRDTVSLAVIGTDTGVGKTIVSALLLARYGARVPVAYWKPVATGGVEGSDTAIVRRLAGHRCTILPEHRAFGPPVSPHLAARRAGSPIDPRRLRRAAAGHLKGPVGNGIVVEGIGGLLVPLTDGGYFFADLLEAVRLPCLLVARSTLGTISHTLLTLEALRARGLRLIGVVLNGPRNLENRRAIERFGHTRVVASVQPIVPLDRQSLSRAAKRFDRPAHLKQHLQ